MQFVGQEEGRASDTAFFTGENNDNRMTNQLASLARRNYCLDEFWRLNLGMYIMMNNTRLRSESLVLRWLTSG